MKIVMKRLRDEVHTTKVVHAGQCGDLQDLCDMFCDFLRGCGFSYVKGVEIITGVEYGSESGSDSNEER